VDEARNETAKAKAKIEELEHIVSELQRKLAAKPVWSVECHRS
jgi:hypothetical protein